MVDIAYHKTDELPYEKMRDSDKYRIPDMLTGKAIKDVFYHTDKGKVLDRKPLEDTDTDTRAYRKEKSL